MEKTIRVNRQCLRTKLYGALDRIQEEDSKYYVLPEIRLQWNNDSKRWIVHSPYGYGSHSLLCRAVDHVKAHAKLFIPTDNSFSIPGWDLM